MSTRVEEARENAAAAGGRAFWWAVVRAVVRRQVTTLWRYPADFWLSLASPFLSLAVAMFLARSFTTGAVGAAGVAGAAGAAGAGAAGAVGFAASSGSQDFRAYLTLSVLFWAFVESQLSFGFGLLAEMERGTLETLFLAPMPRSAYLTGMAAYNFLRTLVNVGFTLLLAWSLFGLERPHDWAAAGGLAALNLAVVYGYGLVLAGAVLLIRSGTFTYAWSSALSLLVGETFSVSLLPGPVRALSAALPLTYGLDALRWAFSGARPAFPLPLEVAVLAVSAAGLPALGLALFGRVERLSKRRGTIGQF